MYKIVKLCECFDSIKPGNCLPTLSQLWDSTWHSYVFSWISCVWNASPSAAKDQNIAHEILAFSNGWSLEFHHFSYLRLREQERSSHQPPCLQLNWRFPKIRVPPTHFWMEFSLMNHPAMGVPPWLWKPPIVFGVPVLTNRLNLWVLLHGNHIHQGQHGCTRESPRLENTWSMIKLYMLLHYIYIYTCISRSTNLFLVAVVSAWHEPLTLDNEGW